MPTGQWWSGVAYWGLTYVIISVIRVAPCATGLI